jgi:hypothetical protein
MPDPEIPPPDPEVPTPEIDPAGTPQEAPAQEPNLPDDGHAYDVDYAPGASRP